MNAPDHRDGLSLARFPVHLGRGGSACAQGEFTGMAFYADYEARTAGDGPDGRLVSLHSFSAPWDSWEMHPSGDELVVCTAGGLVLIQNTGGETCSRTLLPGDYAINPAGTWHTADLAPGCAEATALFITAGIGTQHRERRGGPTG